MGIPLDQDTLSKTGDANIFSKTPLNICAFSFMDTKFMKKEKYENGAVPTYQPYGTILKSEQDRQYKIDIKDELEKSKGMAKGALQAAGGGLWGKKKH